MSRALSLAFVLTASLVAAEWSVFASWSGSGTKETETFQATAPEWRIAWTAAAIDPTFVGDGRYTFTIFVMKGTEPVSTIIAGPNESRGESYVRGAGKYHLKITSVNARWTIAAEQPK